MMETERLRLVITTKDQAQFIKALVTSPKWLQNIGPREVNTPEQLDKYVDHIIASQDLEKGIGQMCIQRKLDNKLVGVCGAYQRPGLDHADIGFALLEEFEGNGYATEANKKILENIKNLKQLDKISGITIPENKASIRVLEKLGLTFKKMINLPNDPVELMLFELDLKS